LSEERRQSQLLLEAVAFIPPRKVYAGSHSSSTAEAQDTAQDEHSDEEDDDDDNSDDDDDSRSKSPPTLPSTILLPEAAVQKGGHRNTGAGSYVDSPVSRLARLIWKHDIILPKKKTGSALPTLTSKISQKSSPRSSSRSDDVKKKRPHSSRFFWIHHWRCFGKHT